MIPMLTPAFAVLLLLGVLISERASRTVLSTAVLFLLGGVRKFRGAYVTSSMSSQDSITGWPCP